MVDLNQAVFTTKHVMKDNSPILHVYHDDDGSWQFFGAEKLKDNSSDIMVVGLFQIIEKDSTIKEVLDLPENTEAHRVSKDGDWHKIILN